MQCHNSFQYFFFLAKSIAFRTINACPFTRRVSIDATGKKENKNDGLTFPFRQRLFNLNFSFLFLNWNKSKMFSLYCNHFWVVSYRTVSDQDRTGNGYWVFAVAVACEAHVTEQNGKKNSLKMLFFSRKGTGSPTVRYCRRASTTARDKRKTFPVKLPNCGAIE